VVGGSRCPVGSGGGGLGLGLDPGRESGEGVWVSVGEHVSCEEEMMMNSRVG
jgi:hypothetical protein